MKLILYLFLLLSDDIAGPIIAAAITALLSGGLFLSISKARKTKPEIAQITVEIAGKAVVVQKGVIESLQNELLRQATEIASLELAHNKCQDENTEFRRTIDDLKRQINKHDIRIEKIETKGEGVT